VEWRDWLPEAAIGTGLTAAVGAGLRLLGHAPLRSTIRTITAVKDGLFNLGSLWMENQDLKAALRMRELIDDRKDARIAELESELARHGGSACLTGSTDEPTAISPTAPAPPPRIRASSRRSGRRKRSGSPSAPTSR